VQVYSFSVRQREEASSAWYCFCCVISFVLSACLLALARLVVWGSFQRRLWQPFLPFKYFTSPSSSLNKEPVPASSVSMTKQLPAHNMNHFIWMAMYANLMSHFFQQKLYFTILRCWLYNLSIFLILVNCPDISSIAIKLITEQDCEAN